MQTVRSVTSAGRCLQAHKASTPLPALARSQLLSSSQARSFRTSIPRLDGVAAPIRKPVGAFRGGIFGFLFGSVAAGGGVYYYILNEYRVSNELLTEDIYSLQAAIQRIETYTRGMEERVARVEKKS